MAHVCFPICFWSFQLFLGLFGLSFSFGLLGFSVLGLLVNLLSVCCSFCLLVNLFGWRLLSPATGAGKLARLIIRLLFEFASNLLNSIEISANTGAGNWQEEEDRTNQSNSGSALR